MAYAFKEYKTEQSFGLIFPPPAPPSLHPLQISIFFSVSLYTDQSESKCIYCPLHPPERHHRLANI